MPLQCFHRESASRLHAMMSLATPRVESNRQREAEAVLALHCSEHSEHVNNTNRSDLILACTAPGQKARAANRKGEQMTVKRGSSSSRKRMEGKMKSAGYS